MGNYCSSTRSFLCVFMKHARDSVTVIITCFILIHARLVLVSLYAQSHIWRLLSRLKRLCTVMSWQLVVLQISPAQTKDSFIQHFTPASPSFVPKTQHLCAVWMCFKYEPAYSWGSQCLLLHLRSCCVTVFPPPCVLSSGWCHWPASGAEEHEDVFGDPTGIQRLWAEHVLCSIT